MSLDHLLLGLLAEPAAGYDLKRVFGLSLRHFWDAELSQIYPTLQRLERAGLLASRREASTQGPARRIYRRTAAGTRSLRAWLTSAPEFPQPRLPWLGQVVFQHELADLRRTRTFFEQLRDAIAERLTTLRQAEAAWFPDAAEGEAELSDEAFFGHLTMRAGILRQEATLAWCDESLRRLDARLARRGKKRR